MSETLRFRCPECTRALAAPISAIGKKIGSPFCQSVYEVSCMIEAESTPVAEPVAEAKPNSLARWIPESVKAAGGKAGNFAGNVANVVKAKTATGLQVAQDKATSAATAVENVVSGTTKRAVAAAAPLTQHLAAVASALIPGCPGCGELMTGNVTQAACTFAAFVGATGLAAAMVPLIPAAPIAGVVVAVPLGIQVFSAWQGSKHGKKAADSIRTAMHDSLTEDEARRIALNMKDAAESMSAKDFERLIIETEDRQLKVVDSGQHRIILKRVL